MGLGALDVDAYVSPAAAAACAGIDPARTGSGATVLPGAVAVIARQVPDAGGAAGHDQGAPAANRR